jgi:hypothetical protein
MLSFVAIVAFSLLLIFILAKLTDLIFVFKARIKSDTLSWTATGTSFLVAFILSMLIVFSFLRFLIDIPNLFQFKANLFAAYPLDIQDCPVLIDTIYQTENSIYNYENHRYIENSSPLFTIKVEYEKGAEKLKNEIPKYKKLKVGDRTQKSIARLQQQLNDKANLFLQRTKLNLENRGLDRINNVLTEMDRTTQARLEIINGIKQQCSVTSKK